jgi:hypothetical protein
MKTNTRHDRCLARTTVAAALVGLMVAVSGAAEAKGGKGGGGGGGGGGNNNNYNNHYDVIHDIAKLNEALQGQGRGFDNRTGGGSDSYEGHPPPWLKPQTLSQRDAWCRERHPSYNRATGTYTTYSGHQRRCVLP